jgi:hypothetical protein
MHIKLKTHDLQVAFQLQCILIVYTIIIKPCHRRTHIGNGGKKLVLLGNLHIVSLMSR